MSSAGCTSPGPFCQQSDCTGVEQNVVACWCSMGSKERMGGLPRALAWSQFLLEILCARAGFSVAIWAVLPFPACTARACPMRRGKARQTWKCGCAGRAGTRFLVPRSISQGFGLREGLASPTVRNTTSPLRHSPVRRSAVASLSELDLTRFFLEFPAGTNP